MSNLNYTSQNTTGLTNIIFPAWLEKTFLEPLRANLLFDQYGKKASLKKGQGSLLRWNRPTDLTVSTTALTEGETPDGSALAYSKVEATVAQYGRYIAIPDLVQIYAISEPLKDAAEILSFDARSLMDVLVRNEIDTNGTAQYADEQANAADVEASSAAILDAEELRIAAFNLKYANVPTFEDDMYMGLINPSGEYDLLSETASGTAAEASKYTTMKVVDKGTVGALYGIKLRRTTQVRVDGANTHTFKNLVFGKDAFGIVNLDGMGLQMIAKPLGAGDDPLNQRSTVGYKLAYVAKTLQASRIRVVYAYGRIS